MLSLVLVLVRCLVRFFSMLLLLVVVAAVSTHCGLRTDQSEKTIDSFDDVILYERI